MSQTFAEIDGAHYSTNAVYNIQHKIEYLIKTK
jgi:hypothetical protein